MKNLLIFFLVSLFINESAWGQSHKNPPQIKIMTLGVFHFNYPNLDAVQTKEKDQISVLDEPFQSEIQAICKAIGKFKPTIIAIECTPDKQQRIDSLYHQYLSGNFDLKKDESYQLGFRIGKQQQVRRIYCVDDAGRHYGNLEAIFSDSVRLSEFEDYFIHPKDTLYQLPVSNDKITSVTDELLESNQPDKIRERLAPYLLHPFKYEEKEGDFTGVDFETGRWFNRNLRIFRNIQRIPCSTQDRILLIIGSEHLNLLNLFFDTSREYEWISPVPYLKKARVTERGGSTS